MQVTGHFHDQATREVRNHPGDLSLNSGVFDFKGIIVFGQFG